MIELLCSCGKLDCKNSIRIDEKDKKVWINHEIGGTDQMMYTSVSRLRRFANQILRAFHRDRKEGV